MWLTNIPSPYRVDYFNTLGKHCELTVIFERKSSSERNKVWEQFNFNYFNGIILKGIKIGADKSITFEIIKILNKETFDHIIISNPLTPVGIIAIEYLRMRKIPYSIVSDGGFVKTGKGIKERFKKHILRGAHIYFSTAEVHDNYYLMYGAKRENLVRYPFTSLKESEVLTKTLNYSEKSNIKSSLGINEEKIVLTIGQFIYRKGFDILLKASRNINKNTGIYIIGGKPPQEYLDLKVKYKISNVHFIDFTSKEVLSNYFKAADIFVLPTREDIWGLVINEAMAHGLPIITTNKCIAGLELVKDNVNGFIIPINDEESLANRINQVIKNMDTLKKMGENSLSIIKEYTVENMALVTLDIIRKRCAVKK